MAGKGTAMDVKLAAGISGAVRAGEVSGFCRDLGISRQTFYKWKRRFEAGGLDGLEEQSRRPLRSPARVPLVIETEIVRLRKHLDDFGDDAGPWSIRQQLLRTADGARVPSEATIWRVLVRRGMVVPEPKKRPKVSFHRFCWERPNDLWQIDATHWWFPDGRWVEIINIIDDHSRVCVASIATSTCTSPLAWHAFELAANSWGLPARVLSDNGLAFNGSRRQRSVVFETNLRSVGVQPIASTPYRPQTCGKVERFHQTVKNWLGKQPAATNIVQLQTQLDTFIAHYNHQRPHRALRGATPADVFRATTPAAPTTHPITDTQAIIRDTPVHANGSIRYGRYSIQVGAELIGHDVTLIVHGHDCAIFHNDRLVRSLTINPDHRYQPSGKPRGGTTTTRVTQ